MSIAASSTLSESECPTMPRAGVIDNTSLIVYLALCSRACISVKTRTGLCLYGGIHGRQCVMRCARCVVSISTKPADLALCQPRLHLLLPGRRVHFWAGEALDERGAARRSTVWALPTARHVCGLEVFLDHIQPEKGRHGARVAECSGRVRRPGTVRHTTASRSASLRASRARSNSQPAASGSLSLCRMASTSALVYSVKEPLSEGRWARAARRRSGVSRSSAPMNQDSSPCSCAASVIRSTWASR